MEKVKKAPLGRGKEKRIVKGNVKNRILQHLLIGEYNAQQLSALTGACDPRAHIRDLRDNGVPISDYWAKTSDRRYKVYFIHKEE